MSLSATVLCIFMIMVYYIILYNGVILIEQMDIRVWSRSRGGIQEVN